MSSLLDIISTTLEEFRSTLTALAELKVKLEKLNQLVSNDEVSPQTANSLKKEYISQLLNLVNKYTKLKTKLDNLKVRCIVELEKTKIETNSIISSSTLISKFRELLDEIDNATEELDMDSRLFIASQYAQYLKNVKLNQNFFKEKKLIYRNFMDHIVESWFLTKMNIESEIRDLEKEVNSLRITLKELWVRFMVGEYDKNEYDSKRTKLEDKLTFIEKRIFELRNKIESVDNKIIKLINIMEAEEF